MATFAALRAVRNRKGVTSSYEEAEQPRTHRVMGTRTTRVFAFFTAPHIDSKMWTPHKPLPWADFVDWLDLHSPDKVKDCGGFFLGELRNKRKKADTVVSRSALNLDADKADADFLADVGVALAGTAHVIYSTFNHTVEQPRYRLLVPLDRDVSPAEFILISRALMEELGSDRFDPTCTQPSRMMLRPATRDRAAYHASAVKGSSLVADDWVARAQELGFDRVADSIGDHGDGVPDYDPAVNATTEQVTLALALLEKAEREVRTLRNETQGEPFGGRNDACIARLPMLYRFVIGGCLTESEVDSRIRAAVFEAEGDSSFDESEYAAVSTNAWEYANLSGGRRPHPETSEDVFGDEPLPADIPPPPRDWPAYRPDRYFSNRGSLQVRVVANAIRDVAPVALDEVDRTLRVYRHGVWEDGEWWVRAALTEMMRNEWTQGVQSNTLEYLRVSADTRRVSASSPEAYINCRNGMLDWRTGDLLAHSPDYLSTVQLPHDWDEEADCPRFLSFLSDVLPDDAMGFIWELIGYMMYAGNPMQKAPILYGPGSNGKGTFLGVLMELLGYDNTAAVPLHDLAENKFASADLYGKLANISGDLDDRWLSSTGLLKQITGDDPVRAERKFGASFKFKAWAVPLFSTNSVFTVSDSSEGFARRMMVIPFLNRYRPSSAERGALFADDELAGILRRGVEGLQTLMERGSFKLPESVEDETHQFLATSDVVRSWLDERCKIGGGKKSWTSRTDLYADFDSYAVFNGSKQMSSRAFYARLRQVAGFFEIKREGVRGIQGIELVEFRGV